jgi:7-cyano-7-deazaguanine tRNA-ribosyltransferase
MNNILKLCDAHFIVSSPIFGPVPIELDSTYPVGQAVIPSELTNAETIRSHMNRWVQEYGHKFDTYAIGVLWDSESTMEFLRSTATALESCRKVTTFELDVARVRAIADLQFGKHASDVLLKGKIKLVKSKRTGKIRNVFVDGKHILSLRAEDGYFTLKLEGGIRLWKGFKPPHYRVVVSDESVEFNRAGKSVFAKFVIDCDAAIRPLDEVLVVDQSDTLVAVGRALMNRDEMLDFKYGIAVKIREGLTAL